MASLLLAQKGDIFISKLECIIMSTSVNQSIHTTLQVSFFFFCETMMIVTKKKNVRISYQREKRKEKKGIAKIKNVGLTEDPKSMETRNGH